MSDVTFKQLRDLFVLRTADGKHRIDVSSNGTTSLRHDALQSILMQRFGEMHQEARRDTKEDESTSFVAGEG